MQKSDSLVGKPEVARNTADANIIMEQQESDYEYYDEEDDEDLEDDISNSRESRRSIGANRLKNKSALLAK